MQLTTEQGGATDVSVIVKAYTTSTGAARTDITDATSGLEIRYKRGATGAVTTVTPAAQTSTGAHTDGGIVHLHGGAMRVDLPDAAVAAGVKWTLVTLAGVSDCTFTTAIVEITGSDPRATAPTTSDIADAVNEGSLDVIETYSRASNTGATITGPAGARSLTLTTDAAYEPIKSIS